MSFVENNEATIHQVKFTGKGGEYFGIWIVNLLLSVVTLGIYSAWAKVRSNQYFYGHTKIDGHSFRYLATPLQILKGRIIAFAFFVAYSVLSAMSPFVALVFLLVFLLASPWAIVQGLKFNMRMTSFRNIRFSFHGSYREALLNFVILPILSIFTAFLALPWVLKRIDFYLYSHIAYGGKRIKMLNNAKEYYIAAAVAVTAGIAVYIALALVVSAFGFSLEQLAAFEGGAFSAVIIAVFIITAIIYWVGFILVRALFQSRIRNHLMASASIEGVASFHSDMHPLSFAGLMLTNTLIILFTLGFGVAFAKVRKANYLAQVTRLQYEESATNIIDKVSQDASAIGSEASDFFDLDLSLT